jgi:regulator of sirC expression with transglutaminase-like and TPR domain
MSADSRHLPFLLRLLEDDSRVVREEVSRALISYGPNLLPLSQPFRSTMDPDSLSALEEILDEIGEIAFGGGWMDWLDLGNTKEGLEEALISLSELEFPEQSQRIPDYLNQLAEQYTGWAEEITVSSLMEFLFQVAGFGPSQDGSYTHLHENLLHVLDKREGNQVSLSCIAILIGDRVGLDLGGISIQGNFMPISFENEELQMFNSFNQGRPLARASIMYIEEAYRRNQLSPLQMKAQVYEVVIQLMRNTIDHLHRANHHEKAQEYVERFRALSQRLSNQDLTV